LIGEDVRIGRWGPQVAVAGHNKNAVIILHGLHKMQR
jgi:hypothetical protein